jgi:hypothetical protein
MASHRFRIGDRVRVGPSIPTAPGEPFTDVIRDALHIGMTVYEVVHLLLDCYDEPTYRIKHGGQEHVVGEGQLTVWQDLEQSPEG